MPDVRTVERSALDPDGPEGWDEVRRVGHRMVDDLVARLANVSDEPVWRPLPEGFRDAIRAPMPEQPTPLDDVYDQVRDMVLGYGPGGIHPRFWGWVTGTGTATGALAELLAASLNGPAGLFNDVTGDVERAVLDWCVGVTGFPAGTSGTITSGASVANLIGLQVAREAHAPGIGARGVASLERPPTVYASSEAHSSIPKAMAALGLGWDALRTIPADESFRLPVDALREAVHADREAGLAPMAVVASAGTVNTGAVDPLHDIADLCAKEGLWLHVDGAVGALARMAPTVAGILDGVGRADSLAFDFHKWLYVPYEAGCVLIRDEALHRHAFATPAAAYLTAIPRGLGGPSLRAGELGPQLSRGFKALKVWMSLREAGVARYREAIDGNVRLARELEGRIGEAPDLELAHRTDLSIVCFRWVGEEVEDPGSGARADEVNREILMRLQERGIAVPSHTVLRDRFYLRCAITNHRTRTGDLDLLLDAVRALGREISRS